MSKKLPPIHPGEHLKEFMDDFGLTMNQLAKALHVPPNRISAIVHGSRGITAETAMRLARYFGTSVQMWMNMQIHYEMEVARDRCEAAIQKQIQPRQSEAA
ncbi:MAG TPA: HigA family addiction module antitoxin [Candidatus Acidoferrales bacterium]|jgi:addiction module HigA family antidote|nr:HigA family addiction module antitoxin [Candidatus Acidoferrales bacterium]